MEQSSESKDAREQTGRTKLLKSRTFSRYVLPSNRHPFGTHFDVLRRFVTMSRNGSEGTAASMVEGEGIPVQAASLNIRFLRSIQLLVPTERGRYVPTPEAIKFVNARSVSDDKARPILGAVLSSTWFADLARSVLSAQPVMSEEQFLGELALAAQTDKTREESALRVILDYLVYVGFVTRDERGLSMGTAMGGQAAPGLAQPFQEALGPSVAETKGLERTGESVGWHILQTEDFYVKVKSDIGVVEDLEAFLGTLKRKIARLRVATAPLAGAEETQTDKEEPSGFIGGR